jgi:cyclic beta-1,2-glucan synthetase
MLSGVLVAAIIGILVLALQPANFVVALPLLLGWILAPEITLLISRAARHPTAPLTADQNMVLRSLARRTWLFFEDFVGPDDHWLPPDHYQETPLGKVAPYTSPTNIGLLLLATLAAYDLGYIGTINLVSRLRATFDSLEKLERYRGHFLNWYDTRSLAALLPRYVSTVDSGNLAACLRILGQACGRLRTAPVLRWSRWEGMADTFGLLDDFVRDLETVLNIPGRRGAADIASRLKGERASRKGGAGGLAADSGLCRRRGLAAPGDAPSRGLSRKTRRPLALRH